jgi:hypothetical protein
MKKKKKYWDTEDCARFLHCHPETIRLKIRRGMLKPLDSTPPYFFDTEVIRNLQRPKVGRPKKVDLQKVDEGKELIKIEKR